MNRDEIVFIVACICLTFCLVSGMMLLCFLFMLVGVVEVACAVLKPLSNSKGKEALCAKPGGNTLSS